MTNRIKFSITISAYKSKYLKECIDSVLAQTYKNFELIILNDCSPEDLDSIILKYQDPRIRYYKNEKNVGAENVVDNWNKLLELAQGEYLICMGDDDELAPNCLEEYNKLIDKYPGLNVYHARTLMIDENSKFCDIQEERPDFESAYSMIWHSFFKNRLQFIGDFLYETSELRGNGGFYSLPLAWGSDYISSFVAAKSTGIANTHATTFYYRSNGQSITNSGNVKLKMKATILYSKWMKEFLVVKPQDLTDIIYWEQIKDNYKSKILHNELFMIASDINISPISNFMYWFRHHKKRMVIKEKI
jgi:glycosyltransferase involved in cell wall biosynthesis